MNRMFVEELALSFGIIAVAVGVLLVVHALAPGWVDTITGHVTVGTSVHIVTIPANCHALLPAGWNLVSFFCLPNNLAREQGLEPINESYTKLFSYDAGTSDSWDSFTFGLPDKTVVGISKLYRSKGYWIYIAPADSSSSVLFEYNGTKHPQEVVTLAQGWNLVGYPTNQSRDINQSFGQLTATISLIRAYNASIPSPVYYPPDASTDLAGSSLRVFASHWGYWVYANTSGTWTITW